MGNEGLEDICDQLYIPSLSSSWRLLRPNNIFVTPRKDSIGFYPPQLFLRSQRKCM